MQSQYIGYGIKGFYRIGSYAIKPSMSNTIIQERLRVLEFWEKHGLQAALDYSNKSRRTLFNWKKEYQRSGLNGLRCKSTTPKTKRKRQWPLTITNRLRFWRTELPNLGKEQLHVLLKPWCTELGLPTPSESTIGRLIGDAHDKMRVSPPALTPKGKRKVFKRAKVTRRPKGYKASRIGECVGLDAIERRMGGMKMYILTYIDEVSDYALAMAVPRLTSRTSKQFFEKCFKLTPFNIEKIITDNGSEFKGEFDQMISDTQITHLWTYPSTPKMNAVCERFNRTIQEQFIDYHEDLLFTDLDSFNEHLADWLVKYNSVRPHKGLGLKTPMQYIIENKPQCNMWWTHTFSFHSIHDITNLAIYRKGIHILITRIANMRKTMDETYQKLVDIGQNIDRASNMADVLSLLKLAESCQDLLGNSEECYKPTIYYYQANAYAALDEIERDKNGDDYFFDWQRPYLTKNILSLKYARNHVCFCKLEQVKQCQILTNLGNALNQSGCTVEALEYWNQALSIIPMFAMALGAKASGCEYYARTLYDEGHQGIFMLESYDNFSRALSDEAFWDSVYPASVKNSFQNLKDTISGMGDASETRKAFESRKSEFSSFDDTKQEQSYREWRATNQLFLNPLNDISADAVVAVDILNLPTHRYKLGEKPKFVEYFDLLKQEYVYSCLLLYEAMHEIDQHYADIDVLLFDQYNYSISGVRSEKLKSSFRVAYSILDKVAVFVNDYFELGKKPRQVNFRNVWYDNKSVLLSKLPFDNFRLRALYTLSLSIFDDNFKETIEPNAKQIDKLRNFLEHRFISIHATEIFDEIKEEDYQKYSSEPLKVKQIINERRNQIYQSTPTHDRISVSEFNENTLSILKIARSSLIYLCLAIDKEERAKEQNANSEEKTISLHGQKKNTMRLTKST